MFTARDCFWGKLWQDMGASGYGCSNEFIQEETNKKCFYSPPCEEENYECKYFITKTEAREIIEKLYKSTGVEDV